MDKKVKVAALSILSNSLLILMKLFIGVISGSVSILSEAIHSSMDLLASIMAYFAVRISSKEPDKMHPYGHGKFENISGVMEGFLIFIAAIWIIYEAVQKLIHPTTIINHALAMGVMFLSALVNLFVSRRIYKVAKETNSIALEADALHLKTDVYTSLGVGIGILFIWVSGLTIFDPIFAIAVSFLIIKEAYDLVRRAFNPLLDARIDQEKLDDFNAILEAKIPEGTCYSQLRVRLNGAKYILDFVLTVPPKMTVEESHSICDVLETAIHEKYDEADIKIHVEPQKITDA